MGTRDKPPSYDEDGDMGLDLDEDEEPSLKSDSPVKQAKSTSSPQPVRPLSVKPLPSKLPASKSVAKTPLVSKVSKPHAKARTISQNNINKSTVPKPLIAKDDEYEDEYDDEEVIVKEKAIHTQERGNEVERLEQLNKQMIHQMEEKDKQLSQILQDINIDDVDEMTDSAAKVKIASLVKKNKTLSLALEKEKTKNSKLQLERENGGNQPSPPSLKHNTKVPPSSSSFSKSVKPPLQSSPSVSPSSDEKELHDLRDANSKLSRQYSDSKDKLMAAQNEIKNLKRVLQREVGDSMDLNKLIEDNSGNWKGRAQQISVLKAKISELSISSDKQRVPSIDNVHREEIAQIAADRRQEYDKSVHENEEMKEEFQKQKLKIEAKESRIKILEGKSHDMQEKMKIILDKSKDDDQLITLLKKEIAKLKAKVATPMK